MSQLKAKQIKLNAGDLILGGASGNVLPISGDAGKTVLRVSGGNVTWESVAAQEVTFAQAGWTSTDVKAALVEEKTRAVSEEARIEGLVAAEETRALAAEAGLAQDIADEATARTDADAAIQSELDATQAGAGLGTSGAYTANGSANYINNATSLFDADVKLDAALKSLSNTVSSGTTALQAEVDQIEASVGLNTDGTLTLAAGNFLGSSTTVVAALGALDTAVKAEETRALAAEGVLQGNIDSEEAARIAEDLTFVKLDGSRALTGNLDAGSNKLTNLAAPTADLDAATKKYVDDKVAGLGSVFEYKGLLDAANDSLPGGAKNGDVYKITASGDFGGTIAVNAGDMIVKTAEGWDKIDNTDPTVVAGANVVVTGSTDAGYTVALASSLTGLTSVATGSLSATGNVTVGGTLGVTGATTLGVVSTGAATLASVDVTGAATVGSTLDVTGAATFGGVVIADVSVQAGSSAAGTLTTKSYVDSAIADINAAKPVAVEEAFAGDATFTLADSPISGSVVAFINGMKVAKSLVTVTGSTITFGSLGYSLDSSDVVEVTYEKLAG